MHIHEPFKAILVLTLAAGGCSDDNGSGGSDTGDDTGTTNPDMTSDGATDTGGDGGGSTGGSGDTGATDTGSDGDGSTGTGGSDDGLTEADMPDVAPCPSQGPITDAGMLDSLKSALSSAANITYLDVPYVDPSTDPDIYKKKCGYEDYWDPADNTNEVPAMSVSSLDPSSLITMGNSGICGTSSDPFGDPAMPLAGTYRKELKVADGGDTYHLRVRIVVSGDAAGDTFSSHGIDVSSGDMSSLDYTVDGSASAHDVLWDDVVAELSTDGSSLPAVTVSMSQEGTELMSSQVEVICAAKL